VVRSAFLPAAEQDADPFVSQGADDDPVTFVARFLHLVKARADDRRFYRDADAS